MTTETPGAGELNLPQAFLLLATNDKDGEPEVPQSVLRAGLSGAILAELDLLGAIQLQGKYVGPPAPRRNLTSSTSGS